MSVTFPDEGSVIFAVFVLMWMRGTVNDFWIKKIS